MSNSSNIYNHSKFSSSAVLRYLRTTWHFLFSSSLAQRQAVSRWINPTCSTFLTLEMLEFLELNNFSEGILLVKVSQILKITLMNTSEAVMIKKQFLVSLLPSIPPNAFSANVFHFRCIMLAWCDRFWLFGNGTVFCFKFLSKKQKIQHKKSVLLNGEQRGKIDSFRMTSNCKKESDPQESYFRLR